jgi:acetyl esterase/lipase
LPQRDAFPAPVEDLRTAVRYLRQNAEHFSVDTYRFVMWGDSSGGHISAMAAITGDGMFDNGRPNQYSSDVAALITWYPPSYLPAGAFFFFLLDRLGPETSSGLIIGGVPLLENLDLAREASTTTYIPDAENIPPTLIITGNNDIILPYNQSVRFYEALRQYGHTAEFVMVLNGNHGFEGAGFFSDAIFDIMEDFIREHVD